MDLTAAVDFARSHPRGVLVTQKRDGRPQLSNVMHTVDDAGLIRISVTADRAKTKNLARDPRASLHITRDDFYAYVVLEGDVELSPVAAAADDATVDELVALYRAMVGEHDDWDLVARLTPTHAYGMLP